MHIAVDARVLSLPEIRGIGSYLAELLKVWPESTDEFLLCHEEGSLHHDLVSPAKLTARKINAPSGSRFRIWDWWAFPRSLSEEGVDLVWSPANLSLLAGRLPQVVTVHDTILQEKIKFTSRFDAFYFKLLVPWWARKHAGRIITVSEFSKERIAETFGYSASSIEVIYNGTSVSSQIFRDRGDAQRFLRKEGLVQGPYLYALGAESAWKNTAGLLRAFSLVVGRVPDILCVVSGIQDRVKSQFVELCRELGVSERVRLLGFVDAKTRDALYQGAELFVYPSLFEGFGLPPLEAMAFGTPVVASNAASIPEVVGDAALIVDASNHENLAEGISTLLENCELRKELQVLGKSNMQRFDWGTSAAAHRKVFEEFARR